MVPDRRKFLGALIASAGSAMIGGPLCENAALAVTPVREPEVSPFARPTRPLIVQRAAAALQTHGAHIRHRDLVALVDFSKPSREARFHLIDMEGGKLLSSHLVAHGSGSDPENSGWARRFSNQYGSFASSNGAYLTGVRYSGKHGNSRRLIGLEDANSAAMERGIVVHGASYVSDEMAQSQGRVGRSQGCFAFSDKDIAGVLERLGEGRLLYAIK